MYVDDFLIFSNDIDEIEFVKHKLSSKFTESQNNSFSREIEDLMTMEIAEQVVIPDPEVVPERALSTKFSGKV
jgi:hypothetical protein